jgi:hypothetical protein
MHRQKDRPMRWRDREKEERKRGEISSQDIFDFHRILIMQMTFDRTNHHE